MKIKAVVNGKEIYPLINTKPVLIPVLKNNPKLVITDGYHITRPLKLTYKDQNTYCYFDVACAISDWQLFWGFMALSGFYLTGFATGILMLKIFSFLPIIYLLTFYYLNRKDFIRLIPATINK